MTKFSKGDKVRFIGKPSEFNIFVSNGGVYEIYRVDSDGDANFYDDRGDGSSSSYISPDTEHLFELAAEPSEPTPVEASPTVIELLANISRRLYEAERYIAMQKRENELAHGHALELERQIREQAYEINELYKAVAERG